MTSFLIGFHFFTSGLVLLSKNWKISNGLRVITPIILSLIAMIICFYLRHDFSVFSYEFGLIIGPFVFGLTFGILDLTNKLIVGRSFYLAASFSNDYNGFGFVGDNEHMNLLDYIISIILIGLWVFWPMIFESLIE